LSLEIIYVKNYTLASPDSCEAKALLPQTGGNRNNYSALR